jgi:hypothetical protein
MFPFHTKQSSSESSDLTSLFCVSFVDVGNRSSRASVSFLIHNAIVNGMMTSQKVAAALERESR